MKGGIIMDVTVTAKVRIYPTPNENDLLLESGRAFSKACNYISNIVYNTRELSQAKLQKLVYNELRSVYKLPSQMACNAVRQVIGSYKTLKSNNHEWTLVNYNHEVSVLSWNRDYSFVGDMFSVGTLSGRIKVKYNADYIKKYLDDTWVFGTCKVINKHKKWFLHISVTKDIEQLSESDVCNVMGIDLGVNFLATTYDSNGETNFYSGKQIKHKRGQYKANRKALQQIQTASSRRKLKKIGNRENRWMQDVNHCITKALVTNSPKNTLFVLEDLTGIRNVTEKVNLKNRYEIVSWSFFDFRTKLEYKAKLNNHLVKLVDPAYTSQICPKCGHTEKGNRNKQRHEFKCKNCGYSSNDDRVASMNLYRKGIEYLSTVTNE